MAFSADTITKLAERFGFDSSESFRMFMIDSSVPDNYNDAITGDPLTGARIYSSQQHDNWIAIVINDTGDYTVDSANFNIREVFE